MHSLIGRILTCALAALLYLSTSALAEQTEGHIEKIDKDTMTLTLDDGASYKLNAEMDVDSLQPGMDIVIAYDVTNGENVITDMEISE